MTNRRPIGLDRAVIGGSLASITGHAQYRAAKSGDLAAAVRLALDIMTDDLVLQVRKVIGGRRPAIIPVISIEAGGWNKIPQAAAEVLGARLALDVVPGIVQSNMPFRTVLSGLDRIFASPEFDGEVVPGQDYLILDDTLTQGGTFAALAGHVECDGGRVIGAVALTGKQYSAILRPQPFRSYVRYMATSKQPSGPQPAMGSIASPSPRPDTSRTSNRLTLSEIASLRKQAIEDQALIRAMLSEGT